MFDSHFKQALVLCSFDAKPAELAAGFSSNGKKTFRKELIHVGKYVTGDDEFHVTAELLAHWDATFDQFEAVGIQVPLPAGHTDDVELNRGEVVGMEVAVNSKGVPALFGYIQFRDEEAEKLAETAQVSIFSPPSFKDGEGREYYRPIRHVALTDYPVVPNLDGFETISASFGETPKKGNSMSTLKNLATQMGIKFEKDASDEVVADNILKAHMALAKSSEEDPPKPEGDSKPPEAGPPKPEGDSKPPKEKPADDEKKDEMSNSPAMVAALNKLRVSTKKNREHSINNLVLAGKITPAVATDLKKEWCGEVSLSFSLENETGDKSFDALVAALGKNEAVISFSEQSGPQIKKGEENTLLKNAKERAKNA